MSDVMSDSCPYDTNGDGDCGRPACQCCGPHKQWVAYVVTAYRWGLRDAHSYVVGAYRDREEAVRVAREHVNFRGGKYGCEVVECRGPAQVDEGGENAIEKQVAYFESPHFADYGRNSPANHPADDSKQHLPIHYITKVT